jgi:UPF0755 protein
MKTPREQSGREAVGTVRRFSARGVRSADAGSRRRALAAVVVFVVAALLVCVPSYGVWRVLFAPEVDVRAGEPVRVEIPDGADTATIASMLADTGVIGNAAMFRFRARLDGIDGELRPGVYDLVTGMPYDEVADTLLAGPPVAYTTVTIPEGFTVEQIAERVGAATEIPADEIAELGLSGAPSFEEAYPFVSDGYQGSLEGYLFPETYRIAEGSTARDVIRLMLEEFAEQFATLDLSYAREAGLTPHEVVTLASMVEREARLADERPLVSSVIYNRLARGMRLEIDATIEYVIKENRPRLLNKDLEVDSPYNTYKYQGLPPGPIASPGLAALQAAAAPAKTPYLYYVLTSADGAHTFTETYEEFLEAKEKSREVTP